MLMPLDRVQVATDNYHVVTTPGGNPRNFIGAQGRIICESRDAGLRLFVRDPLHPVVVYLVEMDDGAILEVPAGGMRKLESG